MHALKSSHDNLKKLINLLKHQGMEETMIFGFIMTLKSCLLHNPDIDHLEVNESLPSWGWNDFQLDYPTFQIAQESFRARSEKSIRFSE